MPSLIGTAGHVDHGKTSLVRALTGIETDRLPEEARRGMTIDIGFAVVDLPGHAHVSIVDVPGHERFLANMLVGALGTDVAMLCVAADEGVMPQTREHLAILGLLPVQEVVVALTKSDSVDAATISLATDDVAGALRGTRFEGAEIVPVSAVSGMGLDELRAALAAALGRASRDEDGPWYMPVDRVFTVAGHGTVVTGTMMRGRVLRGGPAEVVPGGLRARVRTIHGHGVEVESASQGQRAGLNLAGVKPGQVARGHAVGEPGALAETRVLDATVEWIRRPAHARRVRVSIGADEAIARVFHSDASPETAQLRFERPVAAARGQPLIVRDYSPPGLLGGGRVAVPLASPRKKSEAARTVSATASLLEAVRGSLSGFDAGGPLEEVARRAGVPPGPAAEGLARLAAEGAALDLGGAWFAEGAWQDCSTRLLQALEALHRQAPARAGFAAHEAARQAGLGWGQRTAEAAAARLAGQGLLQRAGRLYALAGRGPRLNERQRSLLDRVSALLDEAGPGVPSSEEAARQLGLPRQSVEEIVRVGLDCGELVRVAPGIVYTRAGLDSLAGRARAALGPSPFSASQFREALGTSRKYAIPLLEHFDAAGATLRQGDSRVFR